MNQPTVFISCVSSEFRQTRGRIAAILTRLGYTPVFQDIFGTEPGDLRQVLRDKIGALPSPAGGVSGTWGSPFTTLELKSYRALISSALAYNLVADGGSRK